MHYRDVPAFMQELRQNESLSARALEFTILTAARTSEAIEAPWAEIAEDEEEGWVWSIPAERMKPRRLHRVPLSRRAVELLHSLPQLVGSMYVFPSGADRSLSNMAMLELLRGMRPGTGLTVHGFRSSFRDWVAHATSHSERLAEAALSHKLRNKVEAAYQRGDLLNKRRSLMEEWAAYCERPAVKNNVMRLHKVMGGQ
jgi:integrase